MTAFVAPKVLGLQFEGQVKNLRSAVRKIGKLLRRDFACQAERDSSRFKRLVLRLLQAELPPRPGRPRSNHITLAVADLMSKLLHEKDLDDRDH